MNKGTIQYEKKYFEGSSSSKVPYKESISLYKFLFRINDLRKYKASGTLLDHGCGFGYFLFFAQKYFTCTGIDISNYAIQEAKRINPNCKFIVLNKRTKRLPFRDNSFDAVTSFDVIEHIKNGDDTIKEYARILKKDGILIIHTPTDWSTDIIEDSTHINLYSEKRIRKILFINNFRIRKFYYSQGLIYIEKFLKKIMKNKFSKAIDSPNLILQGNNQVAKANKLIFAKYIIYKFNRLFSYFIKGPEFFIIAQKSK